MYKKKEVFRYYVAKIDENGSEKVNVPLPMILRRLLKVEEGEEIILFYDEDRNIICIEKAFPYCKDCGTFGEEEKVVEIYKDLYFCEKCLNNLMIESFGRGL